MLATDGCTGGLWPMLRTCVVPVFSSIAATAPLAEDVARRIMPLRASLYEAGNITVHDRLDRQGRLLIGGRGPQKPIRDTQPIGYLKSYAARLWPEPAGVEWTHGWNGQLAMTQDQYPHLPNPLQGCLWVLGITAAAWPWGQPWAGRSPVASWASGWTCP